nr:protein bark beetle isoform X1 [Onthophagus taurus]
MYVSVTFFLSILLFVPGRSQWSSENVLENQKFDVQSDPHRNYPENYPQNHPDNYPQNYPNNYPQNQPDNYPQNDPENYPGAHQGFYSGSNHVENDEKNHESYPDNGENRPILTEHPGGTLLEDTLYFTKEKSPYLVRSDLIVEKNARLVIEAGVEVRFEPQTGITVLGVLNAVGTDNERITLTTTQDASSRTISTPDIRLIDGPSILAGRVQLKHYGVWRSVCTNSKNWTLSDMETACRQLGFQGGSFYNWFNRQMPLKPRLLYEEPRCRGSESNIINCNWNSRQMGSGVCDYHPDLAIQCLPRHDQPLPYWRGLRFENAISDKVLAVDNTLRVPYSLSRLQYVTIKYAGNGGFHNATSAIEVMGIPPIMDRVDVMESAYNGINITLPDGGFEITNSRITRNRGYGVFINSTYGLAKLDNCVISENGGDGVRYVQSEERPDEKFDGQDKYDDMCISATTSSQTYPVHFFVQQSIFAGAKTCSKSFQTKYGHFITLNFLRAETDRNNSALIEIYDGSSINRRLLTSFNIRNNTRPQSVTSISNQMYITFKAEERTKMFMYMRLLSGYQKTYDLNVSRSDISENNGRGVLVDNLKSMVHIYESTISKNSHGFHVTSGVGSINVTQSRISFNEGDGINITYTGGSRNISKSSISSNEGYGLAIWLNQTEETEYIYLNQSSVVQYSDFVKNLDIGVLHGNFCGEANVNITGNNFSSNQNDAFEILSCWIPTNNSLKLQIGHNYFISNEKIAVKIYPALNIDGKIEFNYFKKGLFGALLIKNKPLEEFNILKTQFLVTQNYFLQNSGAFAVNLALSPYSQYQYLLFKRNFVKDNNITEPFISEDSTSSLNPRSRVAAPIVIGSSNVDVFRNIIENPLSKYEIGSQVEDQSKTINCTFNWLGSNREQHIFNRIFHRNDRYSLAKVHFVPYLLHNSNPLTDKVYYNQMYVHLFITQDSSIVGGEIEGEEILTPGDYTVEKDINIRPGGKLIIEPGVTLRFPPSIGIMIGGKLEARGIEPDSILFTLKEELSFANTSYEIQTETGIENTDINHETEIVSIESQKPLRLLGGKTEYEGRLQIKINNEWGTVCNYGWTIKNAALVCHQLGLALNPNDWNLERNEIPSAGTSENVILSNVQCEDFDVDITKCRAEQRLEFENSCTHDSDVGIRCYPTSWAGVRFGVLAERSNLQFITIEKSGLLDYATNSFKPALQMDFAKHNFENIRIRDNFHDGLGIMYSDIYTEDSVNVVKDSEFINNKGAGISFKQLGLKVYGSLIEKNFIGIEHNPALSGLQQRELAGWFTSNEPEINYKPIYIPHYNDANQINVEQGETKYIVTSQIIGDEINRTYRIRCTPGFVIGIQLLNPIANRSTENVLIRDTLLDNFNPINSNQIKSDIWSLKRDLTVFPTTSSSPGIILEYSSGGYSLGGTVIVLSAIRAPVQNVYNKIVKGPIPTTVINNSKIKSNTYGIFVSYYNRYLNELGDHFLRKSNESLKIIQSEISHNTREAMFVHSPHWDLHKSNISEIVFMINNSLITDNGAGIYHFSRDMRASNNLFHYILQDDTIERNFAGGFHINLPYVWQYNENFTHSVYMNNNTWRHNSNFNIIIDGHFALVNITKSLFLENTCKNTLLSMRGMEKKMLIDFNKMESNNGKYIIDFSTDSQSEIIGEVPAKFIFNELTKNRYFSMLRGVFQQRDMPSSVVNFKGIQKVNINRNLFSDNNLEYQLIAGIKTAKINNFLDVTENWWGTNEEENIKHTIFDFDDWNNHAIAKFKPYLTDNNFEASFSTAIESENPINFDFLGGRLNENLTITLRETPYTINSDITVMPKTTLTINPGVTLEFAPNVGILVLGTLKAEGFKGAEITLKPLRRTGNLKHNIDKRQLEHFEMGSTIRLCQGQDCHLNSEFNNEGFLEYFNKTTLQWIPMCDPRFTERNAQVVCRELGFDHLNAFFDHGIRIEFHSNSLSRIWSWPQPLQCKGTESRYDDCPIRLNGQQYGHRHECKWNSKFVFIYCGQRNMHPGLEYWGGVRFANSEFEQHLYEHRIHDINTHETGQTEESTLRFVNIIGAGILHNEKSPAIQSIIKSPSISYVNVQNSASHGINLISPSNTMNLVSNKVNTSLGVGLNILSITGEGRESDESSFAPIKDLNIPYHLFGLVDICDTTKEIIVEERVLVYYKYDNHPVNCVKIFRSAYNIKPFGFRLLQFNLFNSTNKYGIPDFIQLYNGDIYNVTSTVIGRLTTDSQVEKKLFKTQLPSLSIKLFANGASSSHGFIAEVVTLPISAIGFNRDVQHNITNSIFQNNREGGMSYISAGEVNPIITVDKNQYRGNCQKLYGNFSTCKSSIDIDVQNTQTLYFRNNLVDSNQGGLSIRADSRGSATSLKGYVHNNLFVNNTNRPALHVEGRQSSPYQEVTIYRNYFTRNYALYESNIVLKQVVSNFTWNYVKRNVGLHNLVVSGFDKVRLPIYQTTTHNGFYDNFAVLRESRSTIVAGTAGQHYVDNIFFNPDNDYEMITVNKSLFEFNSTLELWKTKIDARYNFWGFNTTPAVTGRIKDYSDDARLLEVDYIPFHFNNKSILNGKCPPGWELVGDTCYTYIGAPMNFYEARDFCQKDNATMPYLIGNTNYYILYDFLRKQQQWFLYSDKVWVQHIDRINQCTQFAYHTIELGDCFERNPFICEIDPKVFIQPLVWQGDALLIAIICTIAGCILLLILVAVCWWSKSKYRQTQRFERRSSIRRSLQSLKSVGTVNGFSDPGYRRRMGQLSTRSTDTLTKNSDYKKMISEGSIDSMEKSAYTSTIDDNQSYEIYAAHNPNTSFNQVYKPETNQYAQPQFNLAFKNEGFKDNSTFASNSNYQSRAESVQDGNTNEETPIIHSQDPQTMSYPPSEYYTTDTLPLSDSSGSSLKNRKNDSNIYTQPKINYLEELNKKLPKQREKLPDPPPDNQDHEHHYARSSSYSPDLQGFEEKKTKNRSKSEALLETDFDYYEPDELIQNHPISKSSRSKSQPLETAM